MQILNRSAIILGYKKPFIDWHNNLMPDTPYTENKIEESVTTYLIPDFKDNADAVIKNITKRFLKRNFFKYGPMKMIGHPKLPSKYFMNGFL